MDHVLGVIPCCGVLDFGVRDVYERKGEIN